MDDPARDSETHRAKANGRLIGLQHNGQARSCPYSHYDLGLRHAWLKGFSEGRSQLTTTIATGFAPGTVPERVTYGQKLKCPSCGIAGTVILSENAAPGMENVAFKIELLPLGFRVGREGRSLGATTFACGECDVPVR